MKYEKILKLGIFPLAVLMMVSLVCAATSYSSSNPNYGLFDSYVKGGLSFDYKCEKGQDFIVQIAPFGCSPAVVRSDLLAEQNVPIFCQLAATKINPLIDVKAIESITFSGQYPQEVSGIGFHPAKAALGVGGDINNPVLENIGYAVIILKKQPVESKLPDYVEGTLVANLRYDVENAYGIGKASFYLFELTNEEWEEKQDQYSFWDGKGYLRAVEIGADNAVISVTNNIQTLSNVRLNKGETSDTIYLPGFDCLAGMKLNLDGLEKPDTRVKLEINGEIVEVIKGEKFLENKCSVTAISNIGLNQKVTVKCSEDDKQSIFGGKSFDVEINPSVKLKVNGVEEKPEGYTVGDVLYQEGESKRNVFVGYIGKDNSGKNFIVPILSQARDKKEFLASMDEETIKRYVEAEEKARKEGVTVSSILKFGISSNERIFRIIALGSDFGLRIYEGEEKETSFLGEDIKGPFLQAYKLVTRKDWSAPTYTKKNIKFEGFSEPRDKTLFVEKNFVENYHFEANYYPGYGDIMDYTIKKSSDNSDTGLIFDLGEGIEKPTIIKHLSKVGEFNLVGGRYLFYYTNGIPSDDFFGDADSIAYEPGPTPKIIVTRKLITSDVEEGFYVDYQKAIDDYNQIINSHSIEKYDDLTYGEEALYQEIKLAYELDQKKTAFDLCNYFKEKYPQSETKIKECGNFVGFSNSKSSSAEVMINGELRKISLRGIYEPSSDDYGAVVLVSGTEGYNGQYTIAKNQRMTLSDSEWFELRNVEEDYIEVYASVNAYGTTEKIAGSKTDYRVDKNKITLVGEKRYEIKLLETNLKKLAKVSIIPTIDNSGTSANFSFKVGIEKRAIQLSPEKIKEKIDSLEETITEWEDKSESLGNIVQGLKGACLATGAILTIKNFLENTDGKAIARTNVMRGVGGVYEECEKISGKGMIYSSVDECMNNKSDEIDAKVDAMYNLIQSQNQELKLAHEGCGFTEFLTEKHVDTACFKEKYLSASKTELKNNLADTIMCNNENVNADKLIDDLKSTQISTEDLKNLVLNSRAQSNSNLNVLSQTRLKTTFCGVYENTRTEIKAVEFADEFKIASEKVNLILKKDAKEQKYNELKYKDVKERVVIADNDVGDIPVQIKDSTPVASILTSEGKEYVAVLAKSGDKYVIQQLYDLNGKKVNDNLNVYFKKYDDSSYKNVYQNPEAKYYETEPHKGLPALIPFDKDNGWYVYIKQTLPVVGGIKTYDDSGRVSSFYLCNVGENGREEKMSGDDICQMINLGTGQPYNIFSGMQDKQEVSKIVSRAIENVESVSKQYKDGLSQVYVTDLSGKRWTVKVGSPAADIPDMQCQDFMSPKDCKRLFNVCDPVICPSSRCDLGGAYPVKDVIQSGIIGSLVLCLPNYREGILFPVCLTGIKAGIDGLLSVYKSYRDCLQESLDTGETVGICDEIYSIHLCEFFWRQGLPLAKIAIPKVLEIILGQNIRGGGEYLGLASAWGAAENSVTYFTQYYAANSYKAFKARNAEEVGGEVCKSFISGVYPSGGNVLEQLTEPDSPPQFHGRFDEIPFTTATVPPISHYKVFYHIYAGKDSRAYYQVYLSEGATSSYYQDASYKRIVGSGYISRGEYATETADFTASSGYKKLCIRVNEQEECGFKQVSTSYAIDYIEDKYLEEQALQTDIKKESECISGTASLYSLISPNIQEGVDEAIDPSIYNRGITRICATENPGKGTDVYWNIPNKSRWIEVGYCDNQNIKCWLSRESVGNVINDADIKASVLKEHEKNALELLESEGTILNDQEVNQKITEIKKMSDSNEIINKINEIFDKVILNNYKAELLLLRGGAYGKLAIIEFYKTMKGTSSTEMTDTLDYAVNINDWVVSGSILKPATNLDRFTEKYKTQISDTKYSDPISKYSKEYNVDENLIKAIITQESYPLKETAVERAGSYGLMQVSSGAAEDVGMSGLFKNNQWAIPDNNIKIGTAYYKLLYDKYGDKRLALAAYNCGLGNVDKICSDKNWDSCTKEGFEKYCPNNDVLQYVSNILAYEIKFKNKDYN